MFPLEPVGEDPSLLPLASGSSGHSLVCDSIAPTFIWHCRDFPGGPVVKNSPSNAGYVRFSPGQGTKIPHAAGQLSSRALEPVRHTIEKPARQ